MNENMLSITWNNHSSVLTHNYNDFFRKESYCDATLICESKHIKIHKIVLSACSEYFRELFDNVVCIHPFIILKDVALIELEALLEYMYNGKTSISKARFRHFLNTADYFRVKGLSVSDCEFRSNIKISIVNSDILSSSYSTLACDTIEPISIPNAKEEIEDIHEDKVAKEISNTNSSTKINANKGNKPTSLKKASVSSVNKVQKNGDNHKSSSSEKEKQCTLPSCPEKENSFLMKPVILLNRNEHLKNKKNSSSVSGDSRIGKKMKMSESLPSLLPERDKSDVHRTTRSDKKSSRDDAPTYLSEGVKSDVHGISRSNNSSGDDITEKTKESEVPPSFDLCGDSNLNNLKNPRFRHNCQKCGFSAKFRAQLVAHLKTHNVQTTKTSKRFKCTICTFSTLMKSHLERHERGHKKPLKCKNCTFSASLNISMKKHEVTCLKGGVSAEQLDVVGNAQDENVELSDSSKTAKENPLRKPSLRSGGNAEHLGGDVGFSLSDDDELPDISTPAKESPANKPFGKDYFQCAFCSHKTSSETLLASHVKSTH